VLPREPSSLAGIHETAKYLLAHLNLYSEESGEHSLRICTLAHRLGRSVGLSAGEMLVLRYGTMLHDVGKLDVPDRILHKTGQLSAAESHTMRRHSQDGAMICRMRKMPEEVCAAILFHHERWDGEGYPYGLRGEAVPLASRVIAVVDTYDTIVNKRCFRQAQAVEIARAEIERCAGTQFDPRVAEKFLFLLDSIAARREALAGGKVGVAA